jgi:hypothetical protein
MLHQARCFIRQDCRLNNHPDRTDCGLTQSRKLSAFCPLLLERDLVSNDRFDVSIHGSAFANDTDVPHRAHPTLKRQSCQNCTSEYHFASSSVQPLFKSVITLCL